MGIANKKGVLARVLLVGAAALGVLALALGGGTERVSEMARGKPGDRTIGEASAPHLIVEYASLTCSHCADFHLERLPQIKTELIETGEARLTFRHFPLDGRAKLAAMLSECVPEQRFEAMLTRLFETQRDWAGAPDLEPLRAIARQAGLGDAAIDACWADEEIEARVLQQRVDGQRAGVRATPSFFVDGLLVEGAVGVERLRSAFDESR